MKLVRVDWLDSSSPSGRAWHLEREVARKTEPLPCYSVGWLLRDSKKGITLAAHLTESLRKPHEVAGMMVIPRAAITRLKVLKRA